MKVMVFSILDKKSKVYFQPYFLSNEAIAVREFSKLVNNTDGNIKLFPEDFELYKIGEFDMSEGRLYPSEYPQPICTALTLKKEV